MHIKLLKYYINNSFYKKAIRHIVKIEYKSLFTSNHQWYTTTIDLLETKTIELENLDLNDNEISNAINYTIALLISNHLLVLLNQSKSDKQIDLFIKLDRYICKLDNLNKDTANERLQEDSFLNVLIDLKAQFFYICGLLLLQKFYVLAENANQSNEINKLASYLCLSISLYKSINPQINNNDALSKLQQLSLNKKPKNVSFNSFLIKISNRNWALRYSVISNWFKYLIRNKYSSDKIDFFKKIDEFNNENDVSDFLSKQHSP